MRAVLFTTIDDKGRITTDMFGLPTDTVIMFLSVPVLLTALLFWWGVWYKPEKDEKGVSVRAAQTSYGNYEEER